MLSDIEEVKGEPRQDSGELAFLQQYSNCQSIQIANPAELMSLRCQYCMYPADVHLSTRDWCLA